MDIPSLWNQAVGLLMLMLKGLADVTGSAGLAIIAMTIVIKGALLPLSLWQTRSMKAMQAIQPEIAALKKKVKDREKLTQETMRIYKERGINPASGCAPMLPMMFVLIGLYGALIQLAQCDPHRDNTLLACDQRFGQSFLWMHHLDKPDLLFSVPDHSEHRIEIPNSANPNETRPVLASSDPGLHKEVDDPWQPGQKVMIDVPKETPDLYVVTYTADPSKRIELSNPPREMLGAFPRMPGFDIPIPFLLPIAMAITQYFSSKMMSMPSQDPQQQQMNRMMTIMMPGMMLFWGATFPSGLVLYWLVSNIFEMVRLYFTMGPQSLGEGPGLGALLARRASGPEPPSDGNGAQPSTQTRSDISGDGARANGRPTRPRQKRGKRSGRR